ncbi:MAG: alpha/beta hydrolase [Alphaproteobacteria bacterium]|nr:alpha/beta hydrolase [Alphaproteobacteria bacterium]
MIRRMSVVFAAVILFGIMLTGHEAFAERFSNVSYGSNKLDIYTPDTGNAPVIVFVHGGAWVGGSKGGVRSMSRFFNRQGFVFVSVGYTKYPRISVGQQADQVGQAINWVRSNIKRYGGNPGRIAVMGHSAGCHLASLAILSGRAKGVRALIANDTGAYDLAYLASLTNNSLGILYALPFRNRSKWRELSPITYAGNGNIPVMVIWSNGHNRDKVSLRFAKRLAEGGHSVTRYDGKKYGHLGIRNAVGRKNDLTRAVLSFLNNTL